MKPPLRNEMKYFLSMGSNVGNRNRNLTRARALLEEIGLKVLRASSVYRTQPVDYADQPWFYNQVLEVDADCGPPALLGLIKDVEREMKRLPSVDKGPRTIDIDILLAGQKVIRTRKLTIPHPRMIHRNFVLVPLSEIAPQAVHPLLHEKVKDLKKKSLDRSAVKKVRLVSKASGARRKK